MKDPSGELIDELYDALNGNITYLSVAVPVYTRVIEWGDRSVDRYIHMAEVKWVEMGAKDNNMCEGTVEIFVDTFFTGKNEGSKVPMNSISNSIMQLIDQSFTLTSFIQTLGRVESAEDFDYELDDQGVVFRKLIIYKFITEEV